MGEWGGTCDGAQVCRQRGFWGFFLLLLLGLIAFSTANSFSDAVTVEMIGQGVTHSTLKQYEKKTFVDTDISLVMLVHTLQSIMTLYDRNL